jgi:hypothetical protein
VQPIYRLIYLAHPKPSHPDYGVIDGAYATCWVKDPVFAAADEAARAFIDAHGWQIEEPDEHLLVTEADCPPGTNGREFFEQAQLDGLVLVLNTWPVGAPEDE